ncbi:MAG: ATP-binding cassette domain-containing protein [Bacteroidetes bacterium]|nr:ATP-binding cassette domain-containing protein [Bacteroidota bacterium]
MIEIQNLHKSFGPTKVLTGADLTLEDGEILTVIGKSGVGKSVLIKSIIGLIEPDSGRIIIDGIDVTNFSESRFNAEIRPSISFVFQGGALWDSMTVGANIDLALKIQKGLDERERKQRIEESLRLVDLSGVENTYPDELSGGMLKRASIARAIATRPKYLLYDEPTTGLDPLLSNVIDELILRLNGELGITSLIISHDISGTEKISNRVALLHDGKIVLTCDTKDMWYQDNDVFNEFINGKVVYSEC